MVFLELEVAAVSLCGALLCILTENDRERRDIVKFKMVLRRYIVEFLCVLTERGVISSNFSSQHFDRE